LHGGVVDQFVVSCPACAVGTAVDGFFGFDAVAEDSDPAVCAAGRHEVDGALEAVEGALLTEVGEGECLVVVVSAIITNCHDDSSASSRRGAHLLRFYRPGRRVLPGL